MDINSEITTSDDTSSKKKQFRIKKVKSKKRQFWNKKMKSKNGQFQDKDEQRLYHNQLERKRRNNLKKTYDEVKDCLPCFKNVKKSQISRELTVIKAAEYIRQQPNLQRLQAQIEKASEMFQVFKRHIEELNEAERNGDEEVIERLLKFVPPTLPHLDELIGSSADSDEEAPADPIQKN